MGMKKPEVSAEQKELERLQKEQMEQERIEAERLKQEQRAMNQARRSGSSSMLAGSEGGSSSKGTKYLLGD